MEYLSFPYLGRYFVVEFDKFTNVTDVAVIVGGFA